MTYPNFKQNNPKWKNKKIGRTNLSIGSGGCAIACLSNLAKYYCIDAPPNLLTKQLRFTSNGAVYWNSFTTIYPDIRFEGRINWSKGPADINLIHKLLQDRPIIVETRFNHKENKPHWVKIYNQNGDMGDPLTNSINFKEKYGTFGRWIYKAVWYEVEGEFSSQDNQEVADLKKFIADLKNLTNKNLNQAIQTLNKIKKLHKN